MSVVSRASGNRRAPDSGSSRRADPGRGGTQTASGRGRRPNQAKEAAKAEPIAIDLEHARWRHFSSALVFLVIGGVLLVKLGIVGNVLGVLLMALATRSSFLFLRTLINPAGTIRIDDEQISLPRGLCRDEPASFGIDRLRHVFFLRRAVPWSQTAPVLVIEVDDRAFTYPRDWFASDSDQRRVARTVDAYLDELR